MQYELAAHRSRVLCPHCYLLLKHSQEICACDVEIKGLYLIHAAKSICGGEYKSCYKERSMLPPFYRFTSGKAELGLSLTCALQQE